MPQLLIAVLLTALAQPAPATRPADDWEPADTGDMMALTQAAAGMVRAGEHEAATRHFLWLWDHMLEHDMSMYGVRSSFMAGDTAALAAAHPPAREAFAAERDALGGQLEDGPPPEAGEVLSDWIVLNEVVGQSGRTLDWYDDHADDPVWRQAIDRNDYQFEPLLIEAGRYADVARLYPDPLATARQASAMLRESRMLDRGNAHFNAQYAMADDQRYLDEVATIYAALLAADRDAEAAELMAAAALPSDLPDERPAMLSRALDFGQARPAMADVLDALAAEGHSTATLRRRLRVALGGE